MLLSYLPDDIGGRGFVVDGELSRLLGEFGAWLAVDAYCGGL